MNNEIEFEKDINTEDGNDGSGEIGAAEIPSQVGDPTVRVLCDRIRKGRLLLSPEFQRNYVWDRAKASRLIESVLMRIPLPVVYLAEEQGGKASVIDGQQRLTSFNAFLTGKFPNGTEFKLGKMSVFKKLQNKRFVDLEDQYQSIIEDCPIRTITFLSGSDPELKFNVFERLNTGSVALNDQELRNCIYRGPYNALLKELAADTEFRSLLGIDGMDRRMQDVELVLRFAAFYHQTYLNYKSPIKTFLNEEMRAHQHIGEADAQKLRDAFKNAVSLTKSVMGKNAFHRFYAGIEGRRDGYWERKKFNASLFDITMWMFSREDKNIVMRNKDAILEDLIDLMTTDESFVESIVRSTSSTQMVRCRFDKWRARLEAILSADQVQPRCFSREFKQTLFSSNPVCAICNQSISCIDDAAVDHVEQYWRGGKTIAANARLVHRYCNCHRSKKD